MNTQYIFVVRTKTDSFWYIFSHRSIHIKSETTERRNGTPRGDRRVGVVRRMEHGRGGAQGSRSRLQGSRPKCGHDLNNRHRNIPRLPPQMKTQKKNDLNT